MSKQEVADVLNIDRQSRQLDVSSSDPDLWSLNQINFHKDWDYSLPTIYSDDRINLKNSMLKDIDHFNAVFRQKYANYFSKVNYDHLLIGGGCVIGTLLQSQWDNDVDIFIYGLNQEEADQKVSELIGQIYDSYQDALVSDFIKKWHKEGNGKLDKSPEELAYMLMDEAQVSNVRNKHCISLEFDYGQKIQIILRLYKSISEILHGFDLGSSAIGYDGENVHFTSLGRFSYEYLANIVDTSRRSTTYEKRLMKYHSRGFQIILPYLNMSKLRTDYLKYRLPEVCQLPYFVFSYKNVRGNKIYLDRLLEWGQTVSKPHEEKPDSDYQPGDIDEYKVFYLNLKNLVKNGDNYYYYSSRMNYDILYDPPYITVSRIIDFYDMIEKRIYNKSKFDAKIFNTYFSDDLLPQIVNQLFIEKNYKYLGEIIQKQKQLILDRFDKMSQLDHSKLHWIIKNPGTQLTGSFNPIIGDAKDWYGNYYLPNAFENQPPRKNKSQSARRTDVRKQ